MPDRISAQPLLERIPFFSELPPERLLSLAAAGELHSCEAGQTLVQEGDPAGELFVLLEGHLKVAARNAEGGSSVLAELAPGDFFGEQALIEGGARSATVTAVTPSRLFGLSRQAFFEQMASSPPLLSQVIGAIIHKIRKANQHFFEEQVRQHHLQLEMERQQRQLVTRMVNGVITEMREPLQQLQALDTSLDAHLNQVILAGAPQLADSVTELREELTLQTSRLGLLVHTLNTLSPAEIHAEREPVSWLDYWRELVQLYSLSSFRPLTLGLEIEPAAAAQAWLGTPRLITEIMLHLLLNAEQHAYPDSTGRVSVRLSYAAESAEFTLEVRDFGAGIAPLHLNEVCTPFFSTQRHTGAAGMGLAVVDNLVRNGLGGSLEIGSHLGEGTQVQMVFPQSAPQPAA
ncbi:MAG: cyclic nucleotide-binding domain-containing protein [Candidatus Sericytochromatia bacterium]